MPDRIVEFVADEAASTRLDLLVCRRLDLSRRVAHELIASGAVRLNHRRARKGDVVQRGDHVTVAMPASSEIQAQPELAVEVLYEDACMVAVDKPADMPSQALRADDRDTLASFLVSRFPETRAASPNRLEAGIVHRLDNATSGVLVAARTALAYQALRRQFRRREVRKEYRAVVEGRIHRNGTIDLPLHAAGPGGSRMRVSSKGTAAGAPTTLAAVTLYRPLQRTANRTLLAVEIETGARHQIRAHLAHLGHPVVGDTLYGAAAAERLFLHAVSIELTSPATETRTRIVSPLPDEFEAALQTGQPAGGRPRS